MTLGNLTSRLAVVNDHLTTHTFFVGNRITLADVAFVSSMIPLFRYHYCESALKRIPCVSRLVKFCTH